MKQQAGPHVTTVVTFVGQHRLRIIPWYGYKVGDSGASAACENRRLYFVTPLVFRTINPDTLTGSKSANVSAVKHAKSASSHRASGVPINPPLSLLKDFDAK